LVAAGREASARQVAADLVRQTQGYSRAYAGIVNVDLALSKRSPVDAVEALRGAQKTADLWLTHFLLGRSYVEAGQFPEAIAEFDSCVRRRGEATAIFLDDIPSIRYLAPLPYWQARAQEGLGLSAQAAENYKQFLAIRQAADDALVRDARDRIAKLAP
jgi:tetratricopeptide (TPR) repeat protein